MATRHHEKSGGIIKQYHLRYDIYQHRIAASLFAFVTAFTATAVQASAQSNQPGIRFTATVPRSPNTLPIFALHDTAVPQTTIYRALLFHQASPLRLEHAALAARDFKTNALRAYVEPKSGESIVIPDLSHVTPVISSIRPLDVASSIFAGKDLLPHDVTTYQLGREIPVLGSAIRKPTISGAQPQVLAAPTTRYTFVAARRFAAGYPVYGIGSHASVAITPNGQLSGVLRRWKQASNAGSLINRNNTASVDAAIIKQLAPYTKDTAITVDSIKLAYYDGNANYMQPVYRFTAVLHPLQGVAADARIAGFVPVGQTREAIPALREMSSLTKVEMPIQSRHPALQHPAILSNIRLQSGGTSSRITVGEYLNRDNTLNGMADQFYSGLTLHLPFFPSFGPPIVRTQYVGAYPWEVVGANAQSYLNSVNIAYTQPHGDWYVNTTYSNYADFWDVRNIGVNGNPGFGAAAGGKLATWIIDSCEVVPSFYDLNITTGNGYNAFKPWFPVFQGLHNVIGFRTEMWLYDGMNTQFGFAAQLGGDINSAWFQEIAADPAYNDGYTYLDPHINQYVHMGRASTFIDGRDLGHSIYDVAPQSASTTLWNFWMGN